MASDSTGNVNTRQTPIDKAGQDAINRDFDKTHGGPAADASMVRKANANQTDAYNKSFDDKMKENGA